MRRAGDFEIVAALTTVTDEFSRVSMHGVRETVLMAQLAAAGLPAITVRIPYPCPNDIYERKMAAALAQAKAAGVTHVVFGDLFLADIRAYREAKLAEAGMTAIFPLWHRPTHALAREMIESGIEAHIVCVDLRVLPAAFAGRTLRPQPHRKPAAGRRSLRRERRVPFLCRRGADVEPQDCGQLSAKRSSAMGSPMRTWILREGGQHGSQHPVRLGFVASIARPGGNVTGASFFSADLTAKALGLLSQIVPRARTVGLLFNPTTPEGARQPADAQEAARALVLELFVLNASNDAEIERAFATLLQRSAGALVIGSALFFGTRIDRLAALTQRHRIPTIYFRREFAEAGGLMTYGTSIADAYRQVGVYTARILKGDKPEDLPVMQSTKFEFVINLKTAKALGLDVPPGVSSMADEIIE